MKQMLANHKNDVPLSVLIEFYCISMQKQFEEVLNKEKIPMLAGNIKLNLKSQF